ncbi:hypothetical protein P4O66_004012 [Electrophorus voltai]|uniref:Alkylated DNA repair protein AlkB homologue 8 N-terminal domain-containing protein n=1 Tax=Electrophorus voltai TaxID=2609070 RepID=A0AAD8ZS70_9TELE|nr:hypothetical protein P4O66_004012 [Electrophorus voltai]
MSLLTRRDICEASLSLRKLVLYGPLLWARSSSSTARFYGLVARPLRPFYGLVARPPASASAHLQQYRVLAKLPLVTSMCSSQDTENNLFLNVSKTKELIVDCSKKQERHYQPVRISGTTVERVDSFRYLGVHISQDLSWSRHTSSLAKKARQRLYHLRRLRDFRLPSKVLRNFYTCTIESILTGNITVWFGNSTKQDRQALQRVVRSAERITHSELPDLQTTYYKRCQTKARKIVKDPTHPNNRLFSLLRSGRRFRSLKAKTERLKRSFFPQAIRALNQGN